MRIALVQCPVWGTREPPLSIIQLAGSLKSRGHDVCSFDLNNYLYRNRSVQHHNLWAWEQSDFWYDPGHVADFFRDVNDVIERYANGMLAFDPHIVGLTVTASSVHSVNEFARLLKKKKPGLLIVLGGQHFYDTDQIGVAFRDIPVDFVLTREGDETFPSLADTIESKGDLMQCPGVHFVHNGEMRYTGDRQSLKNLNKLAYVDFSDLRITDYEDTGHLSIMSSRGCVWQCAFCSSCAFWGKYREMDAERIHQAIFYHTATFPHAGYIDFHDLVFNANIARVKEFCQLVIRYPFPYDHQIKWRANAIVNSRMTRDVLDLMKRAGCHGLTFGIESGSQRVLDLMNKHFIISDAHRVIRDTAEAGIAVTTNFMFGFPGETEEDFQETLAFIRATGPFITRAYPSRTYCALEEHSYLRSHADEFGIKHPVGHHLYWESVDGKNTYPIRLQRCQRFEAVCREVGVQVNCGVQTNVEMDEWFNLGQYYAYKGDRLKAIEYLRQYHNVDPHNSAVSALLDTL